MKVFVDEMPKNCDYCPCKSEIWCELTKRELDYNELVADKRPSDCPLLSIQEHDVKMSLKEIEEELSEVKNEK